jgi:hypothetical protein
MNRSIALLLWFGGVSCTPSISRDPVVGVSFALEEVFPSNANSFILRVLTERAPEDAVRCISYGLTNYAVGSDNPEQNIRIEFTDKVETDATASPDSPPVFPDHVGDGSPIRAGRAEYIVMPVSESCDYATAAWADVRVTVRSDESPPRDSVRFSWSGWVSMEIAEKDAAFAPKQHFRVLRWLNDAWVELPTEPAGQGTVDTATPVP